MPNLHPDDIVVDCSICGNTIIVVSAANGERREVHRIKGRPVCETCVRPNTPAFGTKRPAEFHDRTYHGGQFRDGEW